LWREGSFAPKFNTAEGSAQHCIKHTSYRFVGNAITVVLSRGGGMMPALLPDLDDVISFVVDL
jgi:hypothetical protein